jgi:hypothetical protein
MKSSCKKPRTSQRLLEVPTVVQLIPNAIALGIGSGLKQGVLRSFDAIQVIVFMDDIGGLAGWMGNRLPTFGVID